MTDLRAGEGIGLVEVEKEVRFDSSGLDWTIWVGGPGLMGPYNSIFDHNGIGVECTGFPTLY